MTTPAAGGAPAPASPAPAAPSTPTGGAPAGGSAPAAPAKPPAGGTGQPAPGQPAKPAEAPRVFKRKETINGQEREFELTEDDLWAGWRKSTAADQRFEAAAKLRKETEEKLRSAQSMAERVRTNPRALVAELKQMGVDDPLEFITNVLQEELNEEERLKDPNVRRAHEAETKLQQMQREQRERELQQRTQQFEAEVESELDKISGLFTEALSSLELPADDDTLQIMANLERTNRRMGLKITPQQLAKQTQERVVNRAINVFSKLDDAQLLKLDPAFTKRFTKAITDDWKAKRAAKNAPPPAPAPVPKETEPKPPSGPRIMSDKEEWEKLRPGQKVLRTI